MEVEGGLLQLEHFLLVQRLLARILDTRQWHPELRQAMARVEVFCSLRTEISQVSGLEDNELGVNLLDLLDKVPFVVGASGDEAERVRFCASNFIRTTLAASNNDILAARAILAKLDCPRSYENSSIFSEADKYLKKVIVEGTLLPEFEPTDQHILLLGRALQRACNGESISDTFFNKVLEAAKDCISRKVWIEENYITPLKFEKAFHNVFVDDYGALQSAYNYFDQCSASGACGTYYSKSCAIVQASGSGKSRLMYELGLKIPMFYVCFRGDGEKESYPLATPIVRKLLFGISDSKKEEASGLFLADVHAYVRCVTFICSCAIVMEAFFAVRDSREIDEQSPLTAWFLEHQWDDQFWIMFEEIFNKIFSRFLRITDSIRKYLQENTSSNLDFISSLESRLSTYTSQFLNAVMRKSLCWIICVDEARHLNVEQPGCSWSILVHLNRAARLLKRGGLLIFMDTLSDINLLDPQKAFPSDRVGTLGLSQFVFLDTLAQDIFAPVEPAEGLTIYDTEKMFHMVQFGKPLWQTAWNAGVVETEMAGLARVKISEHRQFTPDHAKVMKAVHAIAVLGARTSLDIRAGFCYANKLVGSLAAHVLYYNPDQSYARIIYPSDCVLAMAARDVIAVAGWDHCINLVQDFISSEMVQIGVRGEWISQVLLLRAVDQFKGVCTVRDLLCKVVGDSRQLELDQVLFRDPRSSERQGANEDDSQQRNIILEGMVNFNHFTQVYYTPTRRDLLHCLIRRAAVVCKRGQVGVDLIIPVALPEKYASPVAEMKLNRSEGGAVFSMAKNEQLGHNFSNNEGEKDHDPVIYTGDDLASVKTNVVSTARKYLEQYMNLMATRENPIQESCKSDSSSPASFSLSHSGQRKISHYPIREDTVGYIIIQCKNTQTPYTKVPKKFCAVEAGIDKKIPEYKANLTPHLGLGLYFDRSKNLSIEALEIPASVLKTSPRANFLKIRNCHRSVNASANDIPAIAKILKSSPGNLDVAKTVDAKTRMILSAGVTYCSVRSKKRIQ